MATTNNQHIGVDQYGGVDCLGAHPRTKLSGRLGCEYVRKLYCDILTTGRLRMSATSSLGCGSKVFRVAPLGAVGRRAEGVV
jgi:hypothetical protein